MTWLRYPNETMTIFIIAIIALVFSLTAAAASAAPWLPTYRKDIGRILKLAGLKPGDLFYDLGCGDGRLITAASREGARSIGFDFSLLPYILTRLRLAREKTGATIRYRDFFRQDLSQADVVYMFLTPRVMPRMRDKLRKELRPGAKVISYYFSIPGWKPSAVDRPAGAPPIFVYSA